MKASALQEVFLIILLLTHSICHFCITYLSGGISDGKNLGVVPSNYLMMKVIRSIWFFIALLLASASLAQTEEWQLKILGFEEGLSHRNIFRIEQDNQGYLWIGTVNGLNRYDGYSFTYYNNQSHPEQIASDVVSDLYCDTDGHLWLGHPNYVSHVKSSDMEGRFFTVNQVSLARGLERTPSQLGVDGQHRVWMTTYAELEGSSVLQKFTDSGKLLFELSLGGDYEKHPMVVLDNAIYIAGTDTELWRLDLEGNNLATYNFPITGSNTRNDRIVEIEVDPAGRIFVLLQNGGLHFMDPKTESQFRLHPISSQLINTDVFYTFHLSPNGSCWLASENGLILYDQNTGQWWDFHSDIRELTRHEITYRQIFSDESGVVWVASDFGLIKLVSQSQYFSTYLNGGNSYCSSGFCSMRGITEDDNGNVYFSYYNSIHMLPSGGLDVEPLFPSDEFVNAPFGLAFYDGALFTGNGVRIDLQTLEIDTLFDGKISDTGFPLVDQDDNLWIGYENSLGIWNKDKGKVEPFHDSNNLLDTFEHTITHLHAGNRSGIIWIGTQEAGVYRLDPDSGEISHYLGSNNGLSHDRVLASYEDLRGRLWVATASGLNEVDLVSKRVRVYTMQDGLPNNFINGILPEGDSCIWVSTDNGLSRLSYSAGLFSNFFKEDGLPTNEFNRSSFYQARDGRLYFGGLNGIVSFLPNPAFVWDRHRNPAKLLLTNFSKFDGDIDSMISLPVSMKGKSPIELSWRDKFFTFSFALADYVNPRENRYSYRLRGYEKEWSPSTNIPNARYNNIPAGDYVFEVRAASGNNDWSKDVLTIPLKIQQAYYKSPWFIGMCALLIIGLVYGIMRYRIYTIRQREKYLEEQVQVRTTELEQEKQKSDDLLLNILPAETAEELKSTGTAKAKRFDSVTVMFADFIGFSSIAERLEPEELVTEIDYCFRAFDEIMEMYGIEKIKTIGDAYMCVGGLPGTSSNAAVQVVRAAIEMQNFMHSIKEERIQIGQPYFEARIGIHSGPVVAGIVGIKKFAYDIWGDTVNIASRLEANGKSGKVNISRSTFMLIRDTFKCSYRGKIHAKNKGEIDMYFVGEEKEKFSVERKTT